MREQVIRAIADERAALLGFLGRVGGDAWAAPTVCDGWSVKDVLAHLVEGELNVGRVYRGETREPGFIDADHGVAKWRALPGAAVRAALWQHGVATQRVLETMTEDTWRAPIAAFGCREVRQLVRLHLFDLTVHGHDLTESLGAEPIWGPRLPFVTEFVVRAAGRALHRTGTPPDGALAVRIEGLDTGWVVRGVDDAWRVERDGDPGDASATIEISPDDLVLATTGRRPTDEILPRATVWGDRATAERILAGWRVV